MAMGEFLKWFNLALFALASLAAYGALNKMQFGRTRPCIAAAMLLIMVGSAGQWLGDLRGDWIRVADTATAGGILVLILATQYSPSWFLERWKNPVASLIAIAAGAVMLLAILASPARAQDAPGAVERINCEGLAEVIARVSVYRDVDASEAKVLDRLMELNAALPESTRNALRREIRRMWREGLPAHDAVAAVYMRCVAAQGDMGRES